MTNRGKVRRTISAIAAAAALSSCVSAKNIAELRTLDAGNHFVLQKDYETAYFIALEKMRECWQTAFFLGGGVIVENDLRPSNKTAMIAAKLSMGGNIILLIDFKSLTAGDTEIITYSAVQSGRAKETRDSGVREWIEGTKTDCS